MINKNSITICPKCKSHKVRKEITILTAVGAPGQWVCDICNFRGHLFPQINPEIIKEPKK